MSQVWYAPPDCGIIVGQTGRYHFNNIAAAVTQAISSGEQLITIKPGTYLQTAEIALPKDCYLHFDGTKFMKGSTGGVMIKSSGTLTNLFSYAGNANPSTNADLAHDIQFSNISFNGDLTTTNLMLLTNVDTVKFYDCRLLNATNSIKTVWNSSSDPTAGTIPGGIILDHCIVSANSGVAIDLQNQTQCWVTNSWFSGTSVTDWIKINASNKIHLLNNEYNTATNAVRLQDTATVPTTDITINDNVFAVGSSNRSIKEERTHASSQRIAMVGNTIGSGVITDTLVNSNNIVLNSDGILSLQNLRTATQTPASAAAAGTVGTIAWDSGFIYVCTATNTWKRVAIATW